eukprot:210050_1
MLKLVIHLWETLFARNMSSLQQLKYVNKKFKYCVFGYIRESESKLELPPIPMLISYICLSYYYFADFFSKAREDHFKISNDKLTITNIKYCDYRNHSIFLNEWIDATSNTIVTWTFTFKNTNDVIVGLALEEDINEDFCFGKKPTYAIASWGGNFLNGMMRGNFTQPVFGGNDNVEFVLNLKNGTFGCRIGNKPINIAFENVSRHNGIKYKLAMQLRTIEDAVTIMNFSISK